MTNIQVDTEDGVARLTLNRPDSLNSLSPQLLRDLIDACDSLAADESARVVIVNGAGTSFSSGADLPEFNRELEAGLTETADIGRVATDAIAHLPQITLASIRGHCIGGAVVLASACDLRITSNDARFWIPELQAGIPLAWGGWAHLLRLVGESKAVDMVLSAQPFGSEEAMRDGFVSRVIDSSSLDDEVSTLCRHMASLPAYALRTTKRQLIAIREDRFDARDDADALLDALRDPESGAVFRNYAAGLTEPT